MPRRTVLIGYGRCSTRGQDLAVQRARLLELAVDPDRIYLDHGLTGRNRARPGLEQALAAARAGDTLVVTKLDRLARSVKDACAIADELTARGVRLSLGGTVYDPGDPFGRMFFQLLAVFAEFDANLIRHNTIEGMALARERGRLKGKPPKLSARNQARLKKLHASGEHTIGEMAEMFGVSRATVYRTLKRPS